MLDQSNTYKGSFGKLREERKEFHTQASQKEKIEKKKGINITHGKI